jgi:hypothetical protein
MFKNIGSEGRGLIAAIVVMVGGGLIDVYLMSKLPIWFPSLMLRGGDKFMVVVMLICIFTVLILGYPFRNWIWANQINDRAKR